MAKFSRDALCVCVSHSVVSNSTVHVMPWTVAHQASLSFTVCWGLLKLMSIESVILSSPLILYHPLLLPSVFPSIRVFSNELALCITWSKYWSFSFSISPSNEYSELKWTIILKEHRSHLFKFLTVVTELDFIFCLFRL